MDHDPCPISLVQPTAGDAEEYSRDEISAMIEDVPAIRKLFATAKFRDGTNNLLEKHFPGGIFTLFGANSPGGFRRITRRIMLLDEVDGYPHEGAGKEGDQVSLAIMRTIDFWNRTVVEGSTPTIEDYSRIHKSFVASDQRLRFLPCPHCGHMQHLVWKQENGPGGFWWEYDKPETAVYICEACEKPIKHRDKRDMDANGAWRPTAESADPGHVGFHIWAAYSYQANATWADIVRSYLASKGDMLQYQTWINTWRGECWKDDAASRITIDGLIARCEDYKSGEPPTGVLLLTAGVDCQDDRLECSIIGWGKGAATEKAGPEPEAWVVAHIVVQGHYTSQETWDQLEEALKDEYRLPNGVPLPVSSACVDAGDGEHAPYVYDFCNKMRKRHVVAIKGASTAGKPPIGKGSNTEYTMTGRLRKQGATVYMVGTDGIKARIMARLRYNTDPGPGCIHFHQSLNEDYFDELTSEYMKLSYARNGMPRRQWVRKKGKRAEKLDAFVYAYAALYHTFSRYNPKTIWSQFETRIDASAALLAQGKPLTSLKATSRTRRSFNVLDQ